MTDPLRREQIIRLLETRDDNLPEPIRRDHTIAGFVHHTTARESCPDCLANGRTMKSCETCRGMGWVEVFRERDPYAIDKVQPYGLDSNRHEATKERDRQIARLADQLAPPPTETELLEKANKRGYPWEEARRRMYDDYDYACLDYALDVLRAGDDDAYKALHAVYVYRWLDHSAMMETTVERGLRFVDRLMPDTIRAPGEDVVAPAVAKESLWRGRTERHAEARERRRERVLLAHSEWGWSTKEIARHESLTERRVRQIVADHNALVGETAAVASGPAA